MWQSPSEMMCAVQTVEDTKKDKTWNRMPYRTPLAHQKNLREKKGRAKLTCREPIGLQSADRRKCATREHDMAAA